MRQAQFHRARSLINYRLPASSILISAILAVAGCQSGNPVAGVFGGGNAQQAGQTPVAAEGQVLESELRAFCPPVTLREGTAYYTSRQRGGEGDPNKVIYQASISEVTRDCTHGQGSFTMNVAVAGKVVPGPLGKTGSVTAPIRVAVLRGNDVVYSKLFKHQVAIADTSGATQFVFSDPNIAVQGVADGSVQVLVGFDEG